MKYAKFLVRVLMLLLVTAAFFGCPLCWVACKAQGLLWGAAATLLLGRFFCDALCPLGILQSFVNFLIHPKSHVRRVCSRLPETKGQRIVRWTVLAALAIVFVAGFTGPAYFITPYSIFGKTLALWWPGVAVFAVVMVLAAIGKGRVWCNWICPYGTIYNLIVKISPCKNKIGKGCGGCKACMSDLSAKSPSSETNTGSVTRREALHGVALLAVTEKLTDGGYAPISLPGVPDRGISVLPPGAVDRRKFALKCVGCQLCMARCPGKCIKPSTRLSTFGQAEMDFREGYCRLSCRMCGEVCPEGAIEFLQPEMRPHVHAGYAVWKRDLCIRTTEKVECTACVRKCPVQAIHLVKGFPVVDRDKCIGCGACEHVCPARPMPAIFVSGYENQKVVKPMSEQDLLSEMKKLMDNGAVAVVARQGAIVAKEEGRGIAPLMRLHDASLLRGSLLMDKVVGKAAAAIAIDGGVKKVSAAVVSADAERLLQKNGVVVMAGTVVDKILNRDKTDCCPMEKKVQDCDQITKMMEILRKAIKE